MQYKQPIGQILLFGPSFSGKTYLTKEFSAMGLEVYDLEKEGPYVRWCNDKDGRPVRRHPKVITAKWLASHHFMMDRELTKDFLSNHGDCIVFAHSWDIMDHLDIFSKCYFLYLSPDELQKRMTAIRPDHSIPSQDQISFMKQRHLDRLADAKYANVEIIDASQSAFDIYRQLIRI